VLLDISHLDRELVLRRLPRMYRQFIDLAMLDITMRAVCSTAPRVPELVEDVLPVALDRLAGAA
jgi:hypothetical protein